MTNQIAFHDRCCDRRERRIATETGVTLVDSEAEVGASSRLSSVIGCTPSRSCRVTKRTGSRR
jgi:hypothetical protein